MLVDVLPVGPIQTNCYLVTCPETGKAALIDPGWNADSIREVIAERDATVIYVFNTHAHWDHIAGNAWFVQETGASLVIHEQDVLLLSQRGGADSWNIPVKDSPAPDILVDAGQTINVGTLAFKVLFTPGHTPGHVSFYEAAHKTVFDGDVLFKHGVGRTDLPGGNASDLMRSIRDVLFELPDDVIVYPGHGPHTTIGWEKQHNPWV